jgi:hypothetical protein
MHARASRGCLAPDGATGDSPWAGVRKCKQTLDGATGDDGETGDSPWAGTRRRRRTWFFDSIDLSDSIDGIDRGHGSGGAWHLGETPGQVSENASKPSMAQPGTVPEQATKNASKPSMAQPGTMAKLGTVPGQAPAADGGRGFLTALILVTALTGLTADMAPGVPGTWEKLRRPTANVVFLRNRGQSPSRCQQC